MNGSQKLASSFSVFVFTGPLGSYAETRRPFSDAGADFAEVGAWSPLTPLVDGGESFFGEGSFRGSTFATAELRSPNFWDPGWVSGGRRAAMLPAFACPRRVK